MCQHSPSFARALSTPTRTSMLISGPSEPGRERGAMAGGEVKCASFLGLARAVLWVTMVAEEACDKS